MGFAVGFSLIHLSQIAFDALHLFEFLWKQVNILSKQGRHF